MTIEKRDYYNHGKIEAIDAIESACAGLTGFEGFLTGTILKYMFPNMQTDTCVAFGAMIGYLGTDYVKLVLQGLIPTRKDKELTDVAKHTSDSEGD